MSSGTQEAPRESRSKKPEASTLLLGEIWGGDLTQIFSARELAFRRKMYQKNSSMISDVALNRLKQAQKPNKQKQKKHDHIPKTVMNCGVFTNSHH